MDGRTAWLPAAPRCARLRRPRPVELVRLLNPFDPYLQARDRDLIVPDRAVQKALWPILGRPGVLLVDGEVVGIWRPRPSGQEVDGDRGDLRSAAAVDLGGRSRPRRGRVAAVRGAAEVAVKRAG